MLIVITLLSLLMLVCLMLWLISKTSFGEKVKKSWKELKEKMIWNGVIKMVILAYLKFLVVITLHAKSWIANPDDFSIQNKAIVGSMMAFLICFCFVTLYIVVSYRDLLTVKSLINSDSHQDFVQKYFILVSDINTYNEPWNVFFYPIFFVRRFVFAMLPLVFINQPCLQV